MDFGTLLHVAKKNSETTKNESKNYYSTKFAPPKKESKEKRLSDNIKKFLQKREQEEREREREQKAKLASLLAMRDEKSKNKIRKMLKVTKSANKSVLDDAVNTDHTAVTLDGPEQPDQDDYGYVSKEANALYMQYIEKVKDVKEDKGFAPNRPQSLKDLSGTKERVKAAITREIEDKKNHTRHRSSTSTSTIASSSSGSGSSSKDASNSSIARAYSTSKPLYDPEAERRDEERRKREEEHKRAKQRKPMPPPMDFQALLKLAEKKQHEPIDLPAVKKKEPERLLTSKEKRELEERQRAKEEREQRQRAARELKESGGSNRGDVPGNSTGSNGRIPKLSKPATTNQKPSANSASALNGTRLKSSSSGQNGENGVGVRKQPSASTSINATASNTKSATAVSSRPLGSAASSSSASTAAKSLSLSTAKPQNQNTTVALASKRSGAASSSSGVVSGGGGASAKKPYTGPTREFPPRGPQSSSVKPKQAPPAPSSALQKTRQFPPADVRRDVKKPQAPKRRILDDDDDEDEYDSELDDFIDDGDCEEDISSHIKAIFGYDKSRYRNIDDDEDDAAMESNFAQVQREEFISKKIGLQEDLEDMRLEALEKKRKVMRMKRLKN